MLSVDPKPGFDDVAMPATGMARGAVPKFGFDHNSVKFS